MDKIVSKSQMQTILDNRPKGVPMDDVIKAYTSNGYKVEGINYEAPKSTIENAKDLAIGFGKGVARTAVNTASGMQDIGQGILGAAESAVIGKPLEQTRAMQPNVGIEALKRETPQGQAVTQALQPTNDMQKYGGYAETGAEVLAGGGAGLVKDAAVGGAKLVAKGVSPVGSGVKTFGKSIYESAFTPNVKEAENILAYEASQPSMFSNLFGAGAIKGNPAFKPITTSETALRAGIAGTEKQVGVQAKRVADTLYNKEIAPAVKGIQGIISKEELFAPAEERIANMVDPSKKAAYQNALDSLKEDYANVSDFSFEKAQALKSELAQFTPAKVFRGQDVANETRMIQADMANLIRQKTYEALKDVNIKQKYLDYGNLQELQKVGVKAISEAGTKGGFGGFWSTMYDKAMTPVKTIGGKVLYRIGDKLEVTAPKGFEGKSFSDYLSSVGYLAPKASTEKATNIIGNNTAYGGVAGLKMDENGQVTFDPVEAGIGMAGMSISTKKIGQIKLNNIAKRMDNEDVRIIQDFQDGFSTKKLTETQKENMNNLLEQMKLYGISKYDDMATIGQVLLELKNKVVK